MGKKYVSTKSIFDEILFQLDSNEKHYIHIPLNTEQGSS